MRREFNYSDVVIKPNKKCVVESRKDCDISISLGKRKFLNPCFPSNMESVVDTNTCKFMFDNGYFYVMHRFKENGIPVNPLKFTKKMHDYGAFSSISLGVNEDSLEQVYKMSKEKVVPDYITLDIANIWSPKGERMIKFIKDTFDSFLIAGNAGCSEAVFELERLGVDATKIGIAGGSVCITKDKTGFSSPMISLIQDCFNNSTNQLIADGGIRTHGDINKALVAGANMVMAGSLFAGYDESAGQRVEIDKKHYKEYYGSASEKNKGQYKHVEGKKILVDYKGPMINLLIELNDDVKSGVSYAGGGDLSAFRNCELIAIN
jgi:GMP reductase